MDTILLYSGGLDSLVSLGMLLEERPQQTITCLFFDYGQHTQAVEWAAAQDCLTFLPNQERFVLTRHFLQDYKQYVEEVSIVGGGHIPTKEEDPRLYFVPGRNILFLLYAAILGFPHGCREIAYSPQKWVHAGDCLPEFIDALKETFDWGFSMERQKESYHIWSPIGHLDKAGAVKEGTRLGLPLHLSWSCHDAQDKQCGVCHNCDERKEAYRLAGITDPTQYLA